MKHSVKFIASIILLLMGLTISAQKPKSNFFNAIHTINKKSYYLTVEYLEGDPNKLISIKYNTKTVDLMNNCETEKSQLNSKIDKLNKENDNLRKQLDELKKNPPTKGGNNDVDELKKKLLANVKIINGLRDSLKDMSDTVRLDSTKITKLNRQVSLLNDTILNLKQKIDKLKEVAPGNTPTLITNGHYMGISYNIGIPFVFGDVFTMKNANREKIWTRNVAIAHQVKLYWGSASLTQKFMLSLGAGLEYSRISLSAGIGHLADTINNAIDADNDEYTALLTYNNIAEKAKLHYISVPLTLSFGQPLINKISGYFQMTLAPSFLIAKSMEASGTYSAAGHYTSINGNDADLYLDDYSPLGFGSGFSLGSENKIVKMSSFVLIGRLSGGFYLPLGKTGEDKQWSLKMGVNLDFTLTTISKHLEGDRAFPEATYVKNQYGFLTGTGTRFLNPSFEIGIAYIFKNKNNTGNGR